MNRTTTGGLAAALLAAAGRLPAQIPDRFTNLQVLPKDITRAELVRTMRTYAGELGVRCHHCHVGPDDLQGMDLATDDKPTKRAAREMIRMVQTINGGVVPSLPPRDATRDGVSCYTCHRRSERPPLPLYQELARAAHARGAAAATDRYRELRRAAETGRYEFGPEMLLMTVFTLREQKRMDDALAMARLGVEQHPGVADAHVVLGNVLRERASARPPSTASARRWSASPATPSHSAS